MTKVYFVVGLIATFFVPVVLQAQTSNRDVVVVADTNIGAGNRLYAGFDSKDYSLKSASYWAKVDWAVGSQRDYTECHPVPDGLAIPACPTPVSEVGMNGITDENTSDGMRIISVNVAPAVAGRHNRARIRLILTPKP